MMGAHDYVTSPDTFTFRAKSAAGPVAVDRVVALSLKRKPQGATQCVRPSCNMAGAVLAVPHMIGTKQHRETRLAVVH
jgi:hypothetical protein